MVFAESPSVNMIVQSLDSEVPALLASDSLFTLTFLLTLSEIQFENSLKLSILTVMNTVNSSMFQLTKFEFYSLSF